jgi:hypothetical protein
VQRRWYWKAYFFLGVLLLVLTAAVLIGFPLFFKDEASAPEVIAGYAAFPFYTVQLIGLYGFVYWRRVGSERLWRVVFAITAIETAWNLYSLADDLPDLQGDETCFLVAVSVAGTALAVPMFIALFVYAFRSPALWLTVRRA